MAESRNILLIEDLSSCDHFCYDDGSGVKVRKKYTLHVNRIASVSPSNSMPDYSSIPAMDPSTFDIATLDVDHTEILMADQSLLIEAWDDETIYWRYNCATNSWNKITSTINVLNVDTLVPQTTLPGYIHTDIIGGTQDILFKFDTIDDPVDGCTVLRLLDGEDDVVSTFRQTDATCPPLIPLCTDFVRNASCSDWDSFDLGLIVLGSCTPHKVTLESHDDNLLVVIDDNGFANYKIKDPMISGPFQFSYRVTCEDGEYCTSTITVQYTSVVASAVEDFNVTINDIPATGSVADSDLPCDQGITRFHITQQAANGIVTMDIYGNYIYQANTGFFGTDSFEYAIECCGCCKEHEVVLSTVNIEVLEVTITTPLFTGCQNQITATDPTSSVTCQGGSLGFVLERDPVWGGTLSIAGVPLNVGDTFNAGDIIDYLPPLDFCGVDAFTFSATCDLGNGPIPIGIAAAFIQIQCLSIVPGAIAVGFESTNNQGDVGIMPGCEYYVLDGGVRVPAGTPFYTGNGTVTMALDGTFTYVPDLGFEGPDQFSYEVDCAGCTEQSVVDINVLGPQFVCIGADLENLTPLDGYTISGDVSDAVCGPPEEGFITTYEVVPGSIMGTADVAINIASGLYSLVNWTCNADPFGPGFADQVSCEAGCIAGCTNIGKDPASCISTWSFDYTLLCDGDDCYTGTISGACFECDAVNGIDAPANGNLQFINGQVLCSFGETTFGNASNFVNLDGVTLNSDGTYSIQHTSACNGQTWSFTYDLFCNGNLCDTATLSGQCPVCSPENPCIECNNAAIDVSGLCFDDRAQLDIINPCNDLPISAGDVYIIPGSLVGLSDVTITSVDIRNGGLELDDFQFNAAIDPDTCSGDWSFDYGYLCEGELCSRGTISGTCCTENLTFTAVERSTTPSTCENPTLVPGQDYYFTGESIFVDLPDCDVSGFGSINSCDIEVSNATLVQVITPLPVCDEPNSGAIVQVEIQPIGAGPFFVRLVKEAGSFFSRRECESRFDGQALDRLGCYDYSTRPSPWNFPGSFGGLTFLGDNNIDCQGCPDATGGGCPVPVRYRVNITSQSPCNDNDIEGNNCYRFEFNDGTYTVKCLAEDAIGSGPEILVDACWEPGGYELVNIVHLNSGCDDIPVDCDMTCEEAFCNEIGCTNLCGNPCPWCQDACDIPTEAFTGNETGIVIDNVGPFPCPVRYNWGLNAIVQEDEVEFIGSISGVLDGSGCISGQQGGSFILPAGEVLSVNIIGNCAGGSNTTWGLSISCTCGLNYFEDRFASGTSPRWHYICSDGVGGPIPHCWCKETEFFTDPFSGEEFRCTSFNGPYPSSLSSPCSGSNLVCLTTESSGESGCPGSSVEFPSGFDRRTTSGCSCGSIAYCEPDSYCIPVAPPSPPVSAPPSSTCGKQFDTFWCEDVCVPCGTTCPSGSKCGGAECPAYRVCPPGVPNAGTCQLASGCCDVGEIYCSGPFGGCQVGPCPPPPPPAPSSPTPSPVAPTPVPAPAGGAG